MNKSESKYFNTSIRFNKALLALLETKSFEYITISEVCAEAGVNRSTFYLHYDNTSDLLQETISYVLGSFSAYFDVDSDAVKSKFVDRELKELIYINEEYLHPYLSFIKENQRIFSAVLFHQQTFDTNAVFQRLFDNVFAPILDRFRYPKDEQHYVMMFYLNGITAVVMQWLKDGCSKSIEEISQIIQYCIFGRET